MSVERLSESRRVPGGDFRRYESPHRREQAERTRAAIARAARRRFLDVGWSATRVRDVARDAGVAESTVFAVYGSKAGLAAALVDAIDADTDAAPSVADVRATGPDPRVQLTRLVAADRVLFERHHDLLVLLREAGRSTPELREAYAAGRARANATRHAVFAGWPTDAFRPGVDADAATTTFAALCTVEVYLVLTVERGLSGDEAQRWWDDALATLLLATAPTDEVR